jgi:hypothetical protein
MIYLGFRYYGFIRVLDLGLNQLKEIALQNNCNSTLQMIEYSLPFNKESGNTSYAHVQ